MMELKKATLLAAAGVVYTFVYRTLATVVPDVFSSLTVVKAGLILALPANLFLAVFFYSFYKEYVSEGHVDLKKASVLALFAVVGSALSTVVFTYVLANYIRPGTFTRLADLFNAHPVVFIPVPAASVAAILYFFVVFYKNSDTRRGSSPAPVRVLR